MTAVLDSGIFWGLIALNMRGFELASHLSKDTQLYKNFKGLKTFSDVPYELKRLEFIIFNDQSHWFVLHRNING